ncbi:hypothetical protein ACU686_23770 [Yinghuangia aomiensis]
MTPAAADQGVAKAQAGRRVVRWISVAPGHLGVWQYVFRYSSERQAEKAFRDQSPDKAHAGDLPSLKPVLLPDAYRLSADEQTLITPELSAPDAAAWWDSWARYGEYIVHVVVSSSGPPLPRTSLEPLLTTVDRAVATATGARP